MHKVLDLFAGIGGFSYGLEKTKAFETTAFCEIDKKAQLVLNKHWPDVPIYEDIKELTYERLEADGTLPTVITGGFPCQDISVAGKGKGIHAERSGLWSEMFRLIGDVRPAWAIIENVSALRSKGLTLVLQNLCEIGYMCEWHCIPASCAAIGAPHQRDRIWIIANPNDSGKRTSECGDSPKIREAIIQEWQELSLVEPSGYCEDVANPLCQHTTERGERSTLEIQGDGRRDDKGGSESHVERERSIRCSGCTTEDVVADSTSKRLQRQGESFKQFCSEESKQSAAVRAIDGSFVHFWKTEPGICRVVDGLPNRLDRIKQLGNSVVPQIPYLIGLAIKSIEESNNAKEIKA